MIMTKMNDARLTQHSNACKDRLDFYMYACVSDVVLDASDRTCRKLVVAIAFIIFMQKSLNA